MAASRDGQPPRGRVLRGLVSGDAVAAEGGAGLSRAIGSAAKRWSADGSTQVLAARVPVREGQG